MNGKHRIVLALSLGALVLTAGSAPRAAEPTQTKTADRNAVLMPSPSSPLVSFRLVFRVGSQDDPGGKEGLAALTAAMIAEGGTASLTYEALLEKLYPMAATLNGDCRKEATAFEGTVHRDNLKAYVPLVTELLTTPRFAPDDFERLRNEALDYVTKTLRGNNDEELGKWTLQCELYKGHPYGHPDRGTVQGLRAITLDDVKAFHKRYYTREALTLGMAGGFEPAAASQLESNLASLPRQAQILPALLLPVARAGLEITIVAKPAEATAISIGFPIGVTRRDDEFYALAVANSYLGEHRTFNGKLMQDLRGKRGLNYGDYSYIEDFIQEGMSTFEVANNPRRQQYFSIWVRPVPKDKAIFALRAALWELNRLTTEGMSPADFEATRSFLLNYSKLWVQTLSRRLGYAIDGQFYGRKEFVTELAQRLPRLTVEQVNAAVRKHLKPAGMKIAIVAQNADELRDILTSGKPSPISYDTQGTPENILTEDKQIEAFPLKNITVKVVPVERMFEE